MYAYVQNVVLVIVYDSTCRQQFSLTPICILNNSEPICCFEIVIIRSAERLKHELNEWSSLVALYIASLLAREYDMLCKSWHSNETYSDYFD